MSDARSTQNVNTRQTAEATRTVHRPWVPQDLLNVIYRLRGGRSNGIDPPPNVAAVLGSPPARPRSDEPPLVPFAKDRPGARVILVAVFGLDPAELGRVVELVDGQCATAGVVPIFLTDGDDFQVFRLRRLLFEYLPPPSDGTRFAPNLDWGLYRQRRLALLRRKWQPARIVAFGPVAREALAAWRESPFEDGTIDAAIAGGNGSAAGFP